jgi:hypothetical protein
MSINALSFLLLPHYFSLKAHAIRYMPSFVSINDSYLLKVAWFSVTLSDTFVVSILTKIIHATPLSLTPLSDDLVLTIQ